MPPTFHSAAIPAVTAQSHASNLLQLPDKTLLCAWFGGSQEGLPDISIYLSRQPPSSNTWSAPQKIAAVQDRSCQNPVLFRAPGTGHLWLFHTSQELGDQDGAVVLARTSSDGGETWSETWRPLGDNVTGAFVRQPVVVLADGTWVLPVFHCRQTPGYRWIGNDDISAVYYSRDEGKTWTESVVPESYGAVHMNIVPPSKAGYVAFYRSRWADNIYRSTSPDGLTWTTPQPTVLPNPNSGIAAARLPSGNIALVFNRSASSPELAKREGLYDDITSDSDKRGNQAAIHGGKSAIWGTPRKALTVAVSSDEGLTWRERVLEDGDGFCMTNNSMEKTNRELSYPSILVDGETTHIGFTFHRQHIKYVRIGDVEGWVDAA